jgi:hypothetical protein
MRLVTSKEKAEEAREAFLSTITKGTRDTVDELIAQMSESAQVDPRKVAICTSTAFFVTAIETLMLGEGIHAEIDHRLLEVVRNAIREESV